MNFAKLVRWDSREGKRFKALFDHVEQLRSDLREDVQNEGAVVVSLLDPVVAARTHDSSTYEAAMVHLRWGLSRRLALTQVEALCVMMNEINLLKAWAEGEVDVSRAPEFEAILSGIEGRPFEEWLSNADVLIANFAKYVQHAVPPNPHRVSSNVTRKASWEGHPLFGDDGGGSSLRPENSNASTS